MLSVIGAGILPVSAGAVETVPLISTTLFTTWLRFDILRGRHDLICHHLPFCIRSGTISCGREKTESDLRVTL